MKRIYTILALLMTIVISANAQSTKLTLQSDVKQNFSTMMSVLPQTAKMAVSKDSQYDLCARLSAQQVQFNPLMNSSGAERTQKMAPAPRRAEENWGEWKEYSLPGKEAKCTFENTCNMFSGPMVCPIFVREDLTDATKKQFKLTKWGVTEEENLIIDYDESIKSGSNCFVDPQEIGYNGVLVMDFRSYYPMAASSYPCVYDPETGIFSLNLGYTVESLIGTGRGYGYGEEIIRMAGASNYSIVVNPVNVDDDVDLELDGIVTVAATLGETAACWRAKAFTYEEAYEKIDSCASRLIADGAPKIMGEGTTNLNLKGSDYNYYVVVAASYDADDNLKEVATYEIVSTNAKLWETVGTFPYRDDFVTNIYFDVTGPIWNVEVQKIRVEGLDIYRLKNPFGKETPVGSYTTYENAYLYLNATNPNAVTTAFGSKLIDLGITVSGNDYIGIFTATAGTFDGYKVTFPKEGLYLVTKGEGMYKVNKNGLFCAVVKQKAPEITAPESLNLGESARITSENTGGELTFESLTPEIATVDGRGNVTSVAGGEAKIKITQEEYLEFADLDTTITINVIKPDYELTLFDFNDADAITALGIAIPDSAAGTSLDGQTITADQVSIAFDKGSASTPPRVWRGAKFDLRVYKSSSFTVSVPEGYKLLSIDMDGSTLDYLDASVDSIIKASTKNKLYWVAQDDETAAVTFSVAKNANINNIKVRCEEATGPAPEPIDPSLSGQEVLGVTPTTLAGTYTDLVDGIKVNGETVDWTDANAKKIYFNKIYSRGRAKSSRVKTLESVVCDSLKAEDVVGFPIGFEFNYLSQKFTEFVIVSNGFIKLGNGCPISVSEMSNWLGKPYASSSAVPEAYSIGLANTSPFTGTDGNDPLEISYKSTADELIVEWKNVAMGNSSCDPNDPEKRTKYCKQLHLTRDGQIFWVLKGLDGEADRKSAVRASHTLGVNDGEGHFISVTNFLTDTPKKNVNSSSSETMAAPVADGWTITLTPAGDVQVPDSQATIEITGEGVNYEGPYVNLKAACEGADGVLVLQSAGVEPDTNPVDGTTYEVGDSLGNAVVIDATRMVHTQAGDNFFKAISYNAYGKGGIKYNTVDAPVVKYGSFDPAVKGPQSIEVVAKTNNSLTLKAVPNEAGNEVYVAMSEKNNWDGYCARPIIGALTPDMTVGTVLKDADGNDCGKLVYVGAGNEEFTVEGLDQATYYHFVGVSKDANGYLTPNVHDNEYSAVVSGFTAYSIPFELNIAHSEKSTYEGAKGTFDWKTDNNQESKMDVFFTPTNGHFTSQDEPENPDGSGMSSKKDRSVWELNHHAGEPVPVYSVTSPLFAIPANASFHFAWAAHAWSRFGTPPYEFTEDEDAFEVIAIDENGTETNLLKYTGENLPEEILAAGWKNDTISLADFAGKNISIRIQVTCNAAQLTYFGIDRVGMAGDVAPQPAFETRYLQQTASGKYLALDKATDAVVLADEPAALHFYPVEGKENTYYIANEAEDGYIGYLGTNNWTMTTDPAKKGEWTVVESDGVYRLQGEKGYLATDANAAGEKFWGNKNADNPNGAFNLIESFVKTLGDEVARGEDVLAELSKYEGTSGICTNKEVLDQAKNVIDGIKAQLEQGTMTEQEAIALLAQFNDAEQALKNNVLTVAPAEGKAYEFHQLASGLNLTVDGDNNVVINESGSVLLEQAENGWYLKDAVTGLYISMRGDDNWTMTATAEPTTVWNITLEGLDDTEGLVLNIVGPKGNIGTDDPAAAGEKCWGDKDYAKVGDKALWTVKEIDAPEPTAINGVNTANANANANGYNLSGVRVGADYKGIIINNGKKILKK